MLQILVTDKYTASSLSHLKALLKCEIHFSKSKHPSKDELKTCDAMLIRSGTEITEDLLLAAPQLKLIISATSGFDHIHLLACKKHNVQVMYTPEANANSAAEHSLLLMLALSRKIKEANQCIYDGSWKSQLSPGTELRGKSLGIIGLGRVGSKVAQLAQAFGVSVFAYDPYLEEAQFQSFNVERIGLTELLIQSDIISLHVPLSIETRHLINRSTLELVNSQAMIINTSRGQVIDENELILALESQQIAGAALDVFNKEPLNTNSKLKQLKNTILTPHIGAFTEEAFNSASNAAIKKLADFFNENKLKDCLPPDVSWCSISPA